jgi:uncharacterized YigZ family protein
VETSVRRSRFIATVAPAPDEGAARELLRCVREEFPDATHHCWAFAAGPPGDTARVGMSDDGEPHGTAGRPMLTTLLHSGVGEVAAVVTRYFGGVKLGKGGLGRAYSAAVVDALEGLPTQVRFQRLERWVQVDYPHVDGLFRLLEELGGKRLEEEYGAAVRFRVAVPASALDQLEGGVANITGGAGRVDVPADADAPVSDSRRRGDSAYRSEEGPDAGSGRSA